MNEYAYNNATSKASPRVRPLIFITISILELAVLNRGSETIRPRNDGTAFDWDRQWQTSLHESVT